MYTKSFIFIFLITLFNISPIQAQIATDGTLGLAETLTGPNYDIRAGLGQQHGGNLFHSFSDFNIGENEIATFSGPDTITNVISRVTGGHPSHIDGTFHSNIPNADMYFINPYGIIFGPHAKLDVQGSFHASTAHYLRLGENGRFDARDPDNSLLTIAPVEAFGFLDSQIGSISIEGRGEIAEFKTKYNENGAQYTINGNQVENSDEFYNEWNQLIDNNQTELNVPTGKIFSLIGGNLELQGPFLRRIYDEGTDGERSYVYPLQTLSAPSGRINIASVADLGEVLLKPKDLLLTAPRGNLTIQALQMLTSNREAEKPSGDIYIRASKFDLFNGGISANTYGEGMGGIIDIQADNLLIQNGSIESITDGFGDGGNIKIDVAGKFDLLDSDVNATTYGKGKGGLIDIRADNFLVHGGNMSSYASGFGDGGGININVTGPVNIKEGYIDVWANNQEENAGNGGPIHLYAKQLNLSNTAIYADTNGAGNGGRIIVEVEDSITLNNSRFILDSWPDEVKNPGDGGSIKLKAQQLLLTERSQIRTDSRTPTAGNAGDITINMENNIELHNNSSISSSSRTQQTSRNSGSITLTAGQQLLLKTAKIDVSSTGSGKSGNIDIKAEDIELNSSSISSTTSTTKNINGKNLEEFGDFIKIQAKNLFLNDSTISVESTGKAKAGTIRLDITGGNVIFAQSSQILTGAIIDRDNLLDEIFNQLMEILTKDFSSPSVENENNQNNEQTQQAFQKFFGEEFETELRGQIKSTIEQQDLLNNNIDINTWKIKVSDIIAKAFVGVSNGEILETRIKNFFNDLSSEESINENDINQIIGQVQQAFKNKNSEYYQEQVKNFIEEKRGNLGAAGKLSLEAKTLMLKEGSRISGLSEGSGDASNIDITVDEKVTIKGEDSKGRYSMISAKTSGEGKGGDINLTVGKKASNEFEVSKPGELIIKHGAALSASSFGEGDGGNITIEVEGLIRLEGGDSQGDGSFIGAAAWNNKETASAQGGRVKLTAHQLQIFGGAMIATGTRGKGDGGNIDITVKERTHLYGPKSGDGQSSRIITLSQGAGKAGTITLTTGELFLTDNAKISVSSIRTGQAGDITIHTNHTHINEYSQISATSSGHNADGGNITITSPNYLYLENSRITTSVEGGQQVAGDGGKITLRPQMIVLVNDSKIAANAGQGKGGKIDITTSGIYNSTQGVFKPYQEQEYQPEDRLITALSGIEGMEGTITIDVLDINIAGNMVVLPTVFIDAEALLRTPCSERLAENMSQFIKRPSEGVANAPDDLLPSGILLAKPARLKLHPTKKGQHKKVKPLTRQVAFLTGCRFQSSTFASGKLATENQPIPPQLF